MRRPPARTRCRERRPPHEGPGGAANPPARPPAEQRGAPRAVRIPPEDDDGRPRGGAARPRHPPVRGARDPRRPGHPVEGPWPEGTQVAVLRDGLLLGRRADFWEPPGVVTTAVGYMGGYTPNPTYEETCTGRTGHAETVLVAYDPAQVTTEQLLKVFWEAHDPTQGIPAGQRRRHHVPVGVLLHDDEQKAAFEATRDAYQDVLTRPVRRRSPPRSARPRTPASSTTPRTTTSSTCTRSRGATAASAARALVPGRRREGRGLRTYRTAEGPNAPARRPALRHAARRRRRSRGATGGRGR